MLQALLLEASTYISTAFQQSQDFALKVLPMMQSHPVFALSIGTLIAIPILFLLLTADWQSRLPPRYNYLVPMLLGKYDMKNKGPVDLVRKGYEQHGDCFRMKLGHQGMTFFIGPEAHKWFFSISDKEFTQKEVYGFTVPVFGKKIVYDAEPNTMLQQLKFVRTGLNGPAMKGHAEKIYQETTEYFAKWGQETECNLHEVLSELTILTASRCLLGAEVREKLHAEVAQHYAHMNDGMTHLSVLFPYAPTPAHKRRDLARVEIVKIFTPIIRKRRENAAKGLPPQDDYLQVLVDAKYRDGTSPTDDEIVGLLLAALFAGQHTSNITSTWMGLEMAADKNGLVKELLDEQRRVLGETKGELNFEALGKMELLHATMKEVLRLYPPLILLLRKVQTQKEYKNFIIPKGDIAVVCPSVSHRIPEVWANPDKFDPHRYDTESKEIDTPTVRSFIAFGGGPHQCLGKDFAFLQVKTIWSILLRNFTFELVAKDYKPVIDYQAMVTGPKGDMRMRFKRRPKSEVF